MTLIFANSIWRHCSLVGMAMALIGLGNAFAASPPEFAGIPSNIHAPTNLVSIRNPTAKVWVRLAPETKLDSRNTPAGIIGTRPLSIGNKTFVVFTIRQSADAQAVMERVRLMPGVDKVEILAAHQWQKKFLPNDPRFNQQWHLLNTGQNGGVARLDLNLTNVWDAWQGQGVVIGIVDDGLALSHADLAPNISTNWGYDYYDGDADPSPGLFSDVHGTLVAGVAGARGNNGLGISGVAPQVMLVGIRLISGNTTDEQDADALSHASESIHILNCSWGAVDGTGDVQGPGELTQAALQAGAELGRGGRGTIYVFAAGNGRQLGDEANLDGFANSIYTLTVGAVNDQGLLTRYSENGACVHVVAPSSDSLRQTITTTDLPGAEGEDPGDYTSEFGGTSAAVPGVSGVVALMLQANPQLGWRDVQEILMRTARQVDATNAAWTTNQAGFRFHPGYGAGLVDAAAAVAMAQTWRNLLPQTNWSISLTNLELAIPDNNPAGLLVAFGFSNAWLRAEHAALTIQFEHPNRTEVGIELLSPHGTTSRLLSQGYLTSKENTEWTFTSVRYWGEMATGTWQARITDTGFLQMGRVRSVRLDLYGSLMSLPTLSISAPNPHLLITVSAPPPLSPRLDVSSNLLTWQEFPLPIASNGLIQFWVTNPAPPGEFFRARLAP